MCPAGLTVCVNLKSSVRHTDTSCLSACLTERHSVTEKLETDMQSFSWIKCYLIVHIFLDPFPKNENAVPSFLPLCHFCSSMLYLLAQNTR